MEQNKIKRLKDEKQFFEIVKTISEESVFSQTEQYIQHGVTTVYQHSLAVAYYSCWLAEHFHIQVQKKEMIRGALLHDYFLYDWHDKCGRHFHGFTHPGCALRNASRDFRLTLREKDIIKKHMFPLTPIPPVYREGLLVCIADKVCSTYETFHRRRLRWMLYHLKWNY
ncbi:MAG: HD domain-containing protein [Lachnospiraceae bacterium]|nr:HD domain-containing protein [Lachnospiraceae bacterium]